MSAHQGHLAPRAAPAGLYVQPPPLTMQEVRSLGQSHVVYAH